MYVNRVLEMNDQLASYPGTGDNQDGTKYQDLIVTTYVYRYIR